MNKAHLSFANQTVREIVHVSLGGSFIRVRLSNAYNKDSVKIGAVHIAVRQQGAAIDKATDRTLTFGGDSRIAIPPNALILSDPVALKVTPSSDLSISIFLPESTLAAGIHYSAEQTNYVAAGDVTSENELSGAAAITSWVFLSGVDVAAPASAATLVAFGDSITDGAKSTMDTNHRWPDFLADRLLARNRQAIGVLNEGIGGNRILHDPNSSITFGANALARFDRDVLAQPGVKFVVLLEGINDLGHAGPDHFPKEQVTADEIIMGLKQLVERAHENGIRVYGATLTPFTGVPFEGYFSNEKEANRKKVNEWIRTSRACDAVIDFDKAVQDTARPDHLAAAFDSGDHLHPNDEGYRAMAAAVDLSLFQ